MKKLLTKLLALLALAISGPLFAATVTVSAGAISTSQVSVSVSVGASGSCPRVVRWASGTGQVPVYTTCTGNDFPTGFGFTDSGLSPNTTYFYCGMDGYLDEVGNYSPYSGCNNTATAVTFGPPSAPSNLGATSAGTQINLSWTDGSGNESNFLIERKTGSGGTFGQIASVGANVTSYSNTGLAADTSYFYRVRSTNAYGSSGYTNTASATTVPQSPSGLSATVASATQVNLAWTDASSTESGFKIERKSGAAGTYSQIATVGANVASYSDSGLASGANYFYRVRANNASGDSAYSNEASATLNASPSVSLTSPTANATFSAPASIVVSATAMDTDGTIDKVEIFDGTTLVGTLTSAPYSLTLPGVTAGSHTYSAKATDNLGAVTTSASVGVTVGVGLTLAFIEVDHLNTPRAVYDASQQLRWKWDQAEPFGVTSPNEDPGSLGAYELPIRFPGQYADREDSLFYNFFRDYDSAIGRYIRSDPIGLTGGINTYGYVFQNPLRRFDSLGLYAYGDIVQFWNHYCDGTGTSTKTSFASVNWGDLDERVLALIRSMIGGDCTDRTIAFGTNIEAQAAGADRAIIGRHVVRAQGEINVHCDCTWTYSGTLSSALGRDPYDFDASNRGFLGEVSAWIGKNRCSNTGKAFNIYLTGSKSVTASGTVDGKSSACCR